MEKIVKLFLISESQISFTIFFDENHEKQHSRFENYFHKMIKSASADFCTL